MLRRALPLILAALVIVPALGQDRIVSPTTMQRAAGAVAAAAYYPERLNWQHKKPEDVGMNPALVNEAVQIAIASETQGPKDMALFLHGSFGKEPYNTIVGPIKDRGGASGIITRNGYIVAEWGDPKRADITNSVTKTFLTTVVGLAWQKGMIRDVNDYVRDYMPPHVDHFDSPHNQKIKWDHLLRQTSDWEGTLWGKPDWADRPTDKFDEWQTRPRNKAGTVYKYNDTRVNVLALAALNLWRKPLPQVLKEKIMDPIGASNTWRWFGYDNAWVVIDGQPRRRA
jgi:Beta-lactamase